MEDAVKINPYKLDMLRLLLKDPKIQSCVIWDGETAKEFLVKDNGDILLGRCKYGWVNHLFNSYKEIDFFTMTSKIAVCVTGSIKKVNPDLVGIFDEILNKVLITNNREQIIDLLFQYVVLFDEDSVFSSKFIQGNALRSRNKDNPKSRTIGKVALDLGGCFLGDIPIILDKSQNKQKYKCGMDQLIVMHHNR